MSVIGIDLGTTSSTVAVIRAGGIDIVVNEVSNRRTPSVVGFTPKLRMIGEAGYTQRQRNLKNTISGVKRIIGRNFKDPKLKEELSRLGGCNWIELQDGSIGAEVSLRNRRQTFTSQQITAMLLAHLKRTCEGFTKTRAANAVISVPNYFTDAERRAVLDAAKIAQINCLGVINDISAVALLYGFYRESENINSKVMFLDVGASDVSVAIAHFTPNQCLMLASTSNAFTGGLDLDHILAEYFASRFQEKSRHNVRTNERAWQRLMDGVEKVKKTLNENDQASLNIECIIEDRDLNDTITRAEYLKLLTSSGILERIAEPINSALAEAGIDKTQLDSVEWVGSAMRAAPLQEYVSKVVGRSLSSTMNAEESVAKGCSLACAIASPLMKLGKKYKLIDTQPVPVTLTWKTFNDSLDTKETSIELFPKKQHYDKAKFVTLARKDAKPFEAVAKYVNPGHFPLPDISKGVVVNARVPHINKEPDANGSRDADVRLKIKLDNNGLTHILEAELVEKKEVEVEIEEKEEAPATTSPPAQQQQQPAQPTQSEQQKTNPEDTVMKDAEPPSSEKPGDVPATDGSGDVAMKDAEPPKPEPPKPKIRKEKQMRTFYTKVGLEVKYTEYTSDEIKKYSENEELLLADDNYAHETANAKNRIEAAMFSTRDNLTTIWQNYSKPEEVEAINQFLTKLEDWLENDGYDESKEEYDKKNSELQTLLSPILGRIQAELKRIEDEKRAEEQKRLEEQKRIEEEKKKAEEEQKRIEEEKKKAEEEQKKSTN
jgi:molecular chaperone DnaK (HSP70)